MFYLKGGVTAKLAHRAVLSAVDSGSVKKRICCEQGLVGQARDIKLRGDKQAQSRTLHGGREKHTGQHLWSTGTRLYWSRSIIVLLLQMWCSCVPLSEVMRGWVHCSLKVWYSVVCRHPLSAAAKVQWKTYNIGYRLFSQRTF